MVLRFSMLAVVFLLSCTEISRDNPLDEKSLHYGEGPDDNDDNDDGAHENWDTETLEFKFTDPRDKKVYNAIEYTVRKSYYDKDGYFIKKDDSVYYSVSWMSQNLNYNASGSVCYNNNEANCTTHGRLYDFETAKTACPPGWRLPINGEGDLFQMNYSIEKALGYESCYKSEPMQGPDGQTQNYCVGRWIVGLGGVGSNGSFSDIDSVGYWWTSTEGKAGNAYSLHGQLIKYIDSYYNYAERERSEVKKSLDDKSNFLSVHCVQD